MSCDPGGNGGYWHGLFCVNKEVNSPIFVLFGRVDELVPCSSIACRGSLNPGEEGSESAASAVCLEDPGLPFHPPGLPGLRLSC